MTGRDDAVSPSVPTDTARVRLLVSDDRNRELLADWLAETYEVGTGRADDDPFDVCVVDAASFARHREWLGDRKERTHPVFTPVVLVSRDPPSERLDPTDWTDIDGLYIIDEIVSVPVEKSVLYRRLENLLERRRLSQRLAGRLERSQERFRTLFDGTPDPVFVLSSNHEIRYVNDAFCEGFGTDRDATLGTTLESFAAFSPATAEAIGDHVDRQLAGTPAETTAITYRTPDGTERVAEIKVKPLETAAADDAVVIMRDITDQQWFEDTLQALHAASRALFDATSETEVSHRVVDTATDLFDLSSVVVYLQSEPDGPLEPLAQSLDSTFAGTPVSSIPPDERSITAHVFTTGTTAHFDDIRTSPHQTTETEMRSGIFVPLGDHGVLVVGSPEVGAFDDRTEKLLALLAGSARTALDRIDRDRDLSESERRFRQIADSVHEVIWTADATGEELLYLSPGFEALTGRAPGEFGADPWEYVDTVHPDDRAAVRDWLATVYDPDNCRESYHTEYRVQRPDGEVRWAAADAYPVRAPDGTVQKHVGLIDDITDLKRREQELESKNERLDQFASLVSHDLRNPLQVALSRLEAARETGDDSHIQVAEESLHRMNRLIDDVLEFAKQGQSPPDLELIQLDAIARRAWDSIESDTPTLRVDADVTIKADPDRLLQAFENLYRNAVEHGGPDVTVTVGLLDGGGGFYVADDGPGIPEDQRDQVFEMGYSNESDGTGFGLAMVDEIATSHGWAVTVTEGGSGGVPTSEASGDSAAEHGESGGARFEFTDVYS